MKLKVTSHSLRGEGDLIDMIDTDRVEKEMNAIHETHGLRHIHVSGNVVLCFWVEIPQDGVSMVPMGYSLV